jgi:hypothetical protein
MNRKGTSKMTQESDGSNRKKRRFLHEKGVTWFDRGTERRIFFILTLVMLAWGIVTMVAF